MIGIYLISVTTAQRRQRADKCVFVPSTTSCNNCMVACAIKIYTSIVRGDAKNVVVRVSTPNYYNNIYVVCCMYKHNILYKNNIM